MDVELKTVLILGLLSLTILLFSCRVEDTISPSDNVESMPYDHLSDYRFFKGALKNLEPEDGVIPYDLNTSLFSDYAGKTRFIYVPDGRKAQYRVNDVFEFPVGTILIKNFYFWHDLRDSLEGRTIYETRLIFRKSGGWEAASYLWGSAQSDAEYHVPGKDVHVNWIHYDGSAQSTLYHIPNINECKACHNKLEKLVPIGPKARNINKDYTYRSGLMNQLAYWTVEGILSGTPDPASAPRVPVWDDASSGSLDERARAYLDINCAHCHNVDGPANISGLFLAYDVADSTALGICKSPVAAGAGTGGFSFNIVPGNPNESIMVYRMGSALTGVAMPELARSVVHDKGVQLIRDWIASLPDGECE